MATLTSTKGDIKLTLEIYSFEFPGTSNPDDHGWLRGDLQFDSSNFKVNIENQPQFYFPEMNNLVNSLEQILKDGSGILNYKGTEPYLALSIELKQTGIAQVKVQIRDVNHAGEFSFEFETDQTCVKSFHKELKETLTDFN